MEKQEKRNEHFYSVLNILDKRVTVIENTVFDPSNDYSGKGE